MQASDTTTALGATAAIRVLVAGPDGRMGRVFMDGLPGQDGIRVVGGLRRGDQASDRLAEADVLVDFTHLDSSPSLMLAAIEAGVRPVSGTSNLPEDALRAVDVAARERGIAAVWAPHYRLAGVLLTHLAQIAARYLDSVELVEAHHATKADAPTGYAREFARQVGLAHGGDLNDVHTPLVTVDGVRGGVLNGVRIHSLRLPGIVGWHEAIFAGDQELLTIRHHDLGREAYVPSVANAIRFVTSTDQTGLIRGYGSVLGLPPVPPAGNR